MTATDRTRVKRHPERAVYDRDQVFSILDEGCICHIGFNVNAQPHVLPTAYGRSSEQLYVHGSAASHMLKSLTGGLDMCATVTLLDGFVLARSAFRHSVNYRSVVVYGNARLVTEPEERMEALRCLTNHLVPHRWETVRWPNEKEMLQTTVLALPLNECVAKVRSGPPLDAEDDISPDRWAGVIPVNMHAGVPQPDRHVTADAPPFDPAWNRYR